MRVVVAVMVLLGLIIGCFRTAAAQDDDSAFIAGAQRQFHAPSMPATGSLYLSFTVHVLPSPEQAQKQFPEAVTRLRRFLEQAADSGTVKPASIGDIGDQAQGFIGEATYEGITASLAVIAWREGSLVYTAASAGLTGDQFAELEPIIAGLAGQWYEDSPIQTDPMTGMRTGGAWDLLPDLSDIPQGFVLDKETTLEPSKVGTPTP